VDCDEEEVCHADLGTPVPKKNPRIFFAGEATHPKFFSTVHGAVESGQREAARILNELKRE
jgi:monoamine oxidase